MGSQYKNLLEFNGENGWLPEFSKLAISGIKLYGTTSYGGAYGEGVLFSIDTAGNNYLKLIDFNGSNGKFPLDGVCLSGDKIFGAATGGLFNKGVIYSINIDGSNYKKLFDFNGANGLSPRGTLLLSDNILYGVTSSGGSFSNGSIISIDTTGNYFQSLYSFQTPDGTLPRSTLSLAGNMLYGTCVIGGTYGDGSIFKLRVYPKSVPICMVTVDDSSNYNHIIWEKPAVSKIDSFIVYREITTGAFKRIGSVSNAEISEFIDTVWTKYFPFTGNPNAGTYRYKLQIRDSSGNYSLLSPYHNTIFINQQNGTFTWNQYAIEGDSIPLSSLTAYVLYRDDNSTGTWNPVQGVSGNQTTITDPDYALFPNGRWRVETTWNHSCTPTVKSLPTYNSSRSNIKNSSLNSIKKTSFEEKIIIQPNPSNGTIKLVGNTNSITDVTIYNVLGIKLLSTNDPTKFANAIDISGNLKGIYFLHVKSIHQNVFIHKIILE